MSFILSCRFICRLRVNVIPDLTRWNHFKLGLHRFPLYFRDIDTLRFSHHNMFTGWHTIRNMDLVYNISVYPGAKIYVGSSVQTRLRRPNGVVRPHQDYRGRIWATGIPYPNPLVARVQGVRRQ